MKKQKCNCQFYREKNGAYLCIDPSTNAYYKENLNSDSFEARWCISVNPDPAYVNTGSISAEYLKKCKRVSPSKVPKRWMETLH